MSTQTSKGRIPIDYRDGYPPEFFEALEGAGDPTPQGRFYHRLADRFPGKVLELGCGTGKLVMHLAGLGHECWGLDVTPQFIDFARKRSTGIPTSAGKAEFVLGDMVTFDLAERFSVIFAGCGALCQILSVEDRLKAIRRAAAHLVPGGVLCLATEFFSEKARDRDLAPDGFRYSTELSRTFWANGKEYEAKQVRFYNPISQTIEADEAIMAKGTPKPCLSHRILAHVSTPDELELLFLGSGLQIIERYGDIDERPLDTSKVDQGWVLMVGQKPMSETATGR